MIGSYAAVVPINVQEARGRTAWTLKLVKTSEDFDETSAECMPVASWSVMWKCLTDGAPFEGQPKVNLLWKPSAEVIGILSSVITRHNLAYRF